MAAFLAVLLSLIFVDVAATGGQYTESVLDTTCDMTMGAERNEAGDCEPAAERTTLYDGP